jgi:2-C-methyl-D-erythritol 4-phosphate cytidylyltransferase
MDVAKAFVPISGRPVLWHAVHGVFAAGCVDAVVVAAPAAELDRARDVLAPFGSSVSVVAGGPSRVESVRLALALVLANESLSGLDVVLVHDAARAFTPPAVFAAVVAAVRAGHRGVVPVIPLVDTVKRVDGDGVIMSTVDRSTLRSVQTPQGFAPDVLRRAYSSWAGRGGGPDPVTDDAGLVEALGEPIHTVPGAAEAFKITTPLDLALAEALMAREATAAGTPNAGTPNAATANAGTPNAGMADAARAGAVGGPAG